jgi:hypothetical protein
MMHRLMSARRTLAPALLLALGAPAVAAQAQEPSAAVRARAAASTSVLPGEYRAAPIVFSPAGPITRGRVVGAPGRFESPSFANTDQVQYQDPVYVVPPGGGSLGMSFVIVDSVAVLPGGGIVMQPTGVVRIERTAEGQASTARVVQQFAPIRVGQFLIGMDDVPAATPNPTPVSEAPGARLAWRPGSPALPGSLQWVVLEPIDGATFAPGDQITFVRPAQADSRFDIMLPEEELGQAIVVRSGTHGVTARLLHIRHGVISEGTLARRSARGN